MYLVLGCLTCLFTCLTPTQATCPSTVNNCGTCPSIISRAFVPTQSVQILGNRNMRCTLSGISALMGAGCPEGSCFSMTDINVPFAYDECMQSESEECNAWKWLHCAFPDDKTSSGVVMHAYFFVKGQYQGIGFDFAQKDVKTLLSAAGTNLVDDACAGQYPEEAKVVAAKLSEGESKGLVLFGWDACSCTTIAQSRFRASSLCAAKLTWSNRENKVMKYLQCKEQKPADYSFVYFRDGQGWKFSGNGFAFDPKAMSDNQLSAMATTSSVEQKCIDEFALNVYGEALSECRAASADASGSWMWDGKCTEEGGGVHQICMDQLPADFSVTTGQGPWSEGRANKRHCVCIGAWSLYMTREADPAWTTSQAWPFCDAIPLSSLTSRYISKWKDWNGIPAKIVLGASQLFTKCLMHRSGPGSQAPVLVSACHLAKAYKELQKHESGLNEIQVDTLLKDNGFDCSGVELPELRSSAKSSSVSSSQGGSGSLDGQSAPSRVGQNVADGTTSSTSLASTSSTSFAVMNLIVIFSIWPFVRF